MSTTTAAPPTSASLNALPAGHRLAEFEIIGLVGEGGFGIVYLAQDHSLHRRVAIKEYMPAVLASRAADATSVMLRSQQHAETFEIGLRSFVNEARLLARFDHPALVKVFRFWEANGTAYMAMPYYEGRNLRDVWMARDAREAFDEAWIVRTLAPVIDALEAMHAQNCFHRDVAPDNILLLPDGRPVLLDLGAARRVIGDKTQALTVILKAGFAPVEQYATAPGVEQGPWTDVYALAAVMHVLITRLVPPASVTRVLHDSHVPLARAMREGSAPWTRAHPGAYSMRFLEGIDRCLEVRGGDRPQSMAQMRECLGIGVASAPAPAVPSTVQTFDDDATVILRAGTPSALPRAVSEATVAAPAPAPPSTRRRWFVAASGVSVIAALASGAFVLRRRDDAQAPEAGRSPKADTAPPRAIGSATEKPPVVVEPGRAESSVEPAPAPSPTASPAASSTTASSVTAPPPPAPSPPAPSPLAPSPPAPSPEPASAIAPAAAPPTAPHASAVPAPPRQRPRPRAVPIPSPSPSPAEPAPYPHDEQDRATVREQSRKLDELLGNRPRPSPSPPASPPPSSRY
jgi:serine/threonine protein kinase